MKNIAIVAGGDSSEFEVSLKSAKGLSGFIDQSRYRLFTVLIRNNFWTVEMPDGSRSEIDKNDFSFIAAGQKIKFDYAYITIHGRPGEDGRLQGYFDMLGIPYSSCGVLAGALTFNKFILNRFLKTQGVRVADAIRIRKGDYEMDCFAPLAMTMETENGEMDCFAPLAMTMETENGEIGDVGAYPCGCPSEMNVGAYPCGCPSETGDGVAGTLRQPREIIRRLGLPVFVKPNEGVSSFGVTTVKETSQLLPAIEKAFKESDEVIIERFVEGTEVTCGCYRTKSKQVVFPITEVVTDNEFFDFDAKYNGEALEITPARLTDEITAAIQAETLRIYRLIGAKGIIRIDYIIPSDNQPVLLEINTNPGMTTASFIPQQIKAASLDIKDVMTDIIENV